ncbi:uncharacterized protein LOC128202337 isoform X2 [Galleria mellonella]|uniref:Uncharacterized protein LOC128202337 isoform X2 n=1 Tax=Galleria mellonella TaxID=7137 RepID=A0ABM3N3X6_GALME|nr:uncharacterized protein LOC128202337 isoform X2 [Galleria mellonella]
MNDLYGLLSLMLASFPLLTSADVDCGDKPFHCINSTHFNVCVDLGTGTLRTIDSVTIQCPDGTVCLETNFYECEFPVTSTPVLKTSEVTKVIDMFGAISTDKINISSSKHENSDSTYNTVATTTLSEVERIKDGRAASEITPQGDYTTTPYLIANKSLPVSNEANLKPFVNKAKQNITEGNIPKLPSDDIYSTTIVSNMLSEEFSTKYNQNITPLEENIIDDTINENSNDNVLTGIDTTVTYMPKVQNNNYLTDNYLNLFKNEFTVFNNSILSNAPPTEYLISNNTFNIDELHDKLISSFETESTDISLDMIADFIDDGILKNTGFSRDVKGDNDILISTANKVIVEIESLNTQPVQISSTYLSSTADYITENIPEFKQSLTGFSSETLTSSIMSHDITTESIDDIILTSTIDKIDSLTTKSSAQTLTTYLPSTVDFITESIPENKQSSTGFSSETLTSSIIAHDLTTESIDDIILTSTIDKIDSLTTKSSAQTLTTYLPSTADFTTESIPEIKQSSTGFSSETLTSSIMSHDITTESIDDIILTSTIDKIDSSTTKPSAQTLTTYIPSTVDFTIESIPEIKQSSTGFSSETLTPSIISHDITTESIDDIILTSTIDKIDSSTTKPSAQMLTTYIPSTMDFTTESIPENKQRLTDFSSETLTSSKMSHDITTESIDDIILTSTIDKIDSSTTKPSAQTLTTYKPSTVDFTTESIPKIKQISTILSSETLTTSINSHDIMAESIDDIILTSTIDKLDSSTTKSSAQTLTTYLPSTADFTTESIPEIKQSSTGFSSETLTSLIISHDMTTESIDDIILTSTIDKIDSSTTKPSAQTLTTYLPSTADFTTESIPENKQSSTGFSSETLTSSIISHDVTTKSIDDIILTSTIDKIDSSTTKSSAQTLTTYLPSTADFPTESIPEIKQSSTGFSSETLTSSIISHDITTESIDDIILTSTIDKIDSSTTKPSAQTLTTYIPSTVDFTIESIPEIKQRLTDFSSETLTSSIISHDITTESIDDIILTSAIDKIDSSTTKPSAQTLTTYKPTTVNFTTESIPEIKQISTILSSETLTTSINSHDITAESIDDIILTSIIDKIDSSTTKPSAQTLTTYIPSTADFTTESIPKIKQSSTGFSSETLTSSIISHDITTESIDDIILTSTIDKIDSSTTKPSAQTLTTYIPSTVDFTTERIPEIIQSSTGISSETLTSSIISHDITTESIDDIILTSTIDKIDSSTTKPSAQTLTTYIPSTADFTTESIPEIKQSSTGFSSETLTSLIISHDITTESIDDIILTSTTDKIDSSTTKPSAQMLTTYIPSTMDFTTESIPENKQRSTGFSSETLTSSIIAHDLTTESIDDIILTSTIDKIDSSTTKSSAQTLTTYLPSTVNFTTESIPEIKQISTILSSETLTTSINSYGITAESIDDIILTSTIDKIDSSTTKPSAQTITTDFAFLVDYDTSAIIREITTGSINDNILTSNIDELDPLITEPFAQTPPAHLTSRKDIIIENISEISESLMSPAFETRDISKISRYTTAEFIEDITLTPTIDKVVGEIDSSTTESTAQILITDLSSTVDFITESIAEDTQSLSLSTLKSNISNNIDSSSEILNTIKNKSKSPFVEFEEPSSTGNIGTFDITYNNSESMLKTEGKTKSLPDILTDITRNSSTTSTSHSNESSVLKNNSKQGGIISLKTYSTENSRENTLDINNKQNTTTSYILKKDKSVHERLQFTSPLPHIETTTLDIPILTTNIGYPTTSLNNLLQQNINATQYNIQQSNISTFITDPNESRFFNSSEIDFKNEIKLENFTENLQITTENRLQVITNKSNITNNKETNILSQPLITIDNRKSQHNSQYDGLSNLNQHNFTQLVKPNMTEKPITSVYSVLKSNFSCRNRKNGKYGDNNDCSTFYICIGRQNPIKRKCPVNTVFSEIRKQCTNNLSHCIRNNTFRCLSEGRFSDIFKDKFYYICIKNNSSFIRYKFQCADGFHLNKTSVKCIKDIEISQSEDSLSKNSSEKSIFEANSSEKSDNYHSNKFECKEAGKFADPTNCRKYYECIKKKSRFRRKSKKCKKNKVFDRDKKTCVDNESYEC